MDEAQSDVLLDLVKATAAMRQLYDLFAVLHGEEAEEVAQSQAVAETAQAIVDLFIKGIEIGFHEDYLNTFINERLPADARFEFTITHQEA